MKRYIILLFILLTFFPQTLSARMDDGTFNVSCTMFYELNVSGDFEVEIHPSDSSSVSVSVNPAFKDYVVLDESEGVLSLSFAEQDMSAEKKREFKSLAPKDLVFKAVVYTSAPLSSINLEDNACLTVCRSVADSSFLSIRASDNASVKLDTLVSSKVLLDFSKKASGSLFVAARSLTVNEGGSAKVSLGYSCESCELNLGANSLIESEGVSSDLGVSSRGTSKLTLAGKSLNSKFEISGSSSVAALDLESIDAQVKMSSLSSLKLFCRDNLQLDLSSGSTLGFKGTPRIEIIQVKASNITPLEG